jgi:peptidoglycan-associated lipoprotein
MKRTLIAVSVIGIALSACSSAPKKSELAATPAAPNPVAVQNGAQTAPVATNPVAAGTETEAAKLDRIIHILASNSIYFDFDKFSIKPEYMTTIRHDYDLLKANPEAAVRLEGNCDERGSVGYNIALGQKRADAVRKALVVLGIDEAKLETVSYGKERPRCTEHTEQCWAQNRRVDFARK